MASQLTDAFARKFYYLRLSIVDVIVTFVALPASPDGYKPSGVTNKVLSYRRWMPGYARLRQSGQ